MRAICLFLSATSLSACAHAAPMFRDESLSAPSRDVALEDEQDEIAWSGRGFNRAAARISLRDAAYESTACVKDQNWLKTLTIRVTFEPAGTVSTVQMDGPIRQDERVVACTMAKYERVRIPEYAGGPITLGGPFTNIVGVRAGDHRRATWSSR
jgi:hypothetical protein